MTSTEISYGKAHVLFYRLGGRDMAPLAASVDIDVFGKRFVSAYTEGDNRAVVATVRTAGDHPSVARSKGNARVWATAR